MIAAAANWLLEPLQQLFIQRALALGLLVAVSSTGSNQRVMTSSDGRNWTLRTAAVANNWTALCWAAELGLLVALSSSGKGIKINYYAAVNSELGAVAFKFVTGTTGHRRRYKVRTHLPVESCRRCWRCSLLPTSSQCSTSTVRLVGRL